jgi:hypothetical protein
MTWYWVLAIVVGSVVGLWIVGVITAAGAWWTVIAWLRDLGNLAMLIFALISVVGFGAGLFGAAATSSRPLAWSAAFLLVGGVALFALGARAAERGRPSAKGLLGLPLLVAALACVAADLATHGRTVEISWWVPLIALGAFGSVFVLLALFSSGRTGMRVAWGLVGLGLLAPSLSVALALGLFDRVRR